MERRRRRFRGIAIVFTALLFILSPLIPSTAGEEGGNQKGGKNDDHHEPNAAERAIGLTPPTGHWVKIKSWLNMPLINFRPPDSEMDKYPSGACEVVKEVASTSLEASKKTAEKAAQVADDVVHKTADKVKKTVSHSGEYTHTEL